VSEGALQFKEINKLEGYLGQCIKCGFCNYWCPVYQEELVESSVARGKQMMVRALVDGKLQFTREFTEHLNKCTLCGKCTLNCPTRVNTPDIIVAARADKVNSKGIALPLNIIYRWILPNRIIFGSVLRFASWCQNIFMPKTEGTIRHLPFFLSALGKGRRVPQIAPRFLRQIVPVINKPPAGIKTIKRVGYFSGCMTDYVFPDLGQKLIQLLNKNGVEVIIPREQGCCGAPVFLGAGDFKTGRKLANRNVQIFKDVDCVVTDCATCGSAMKDYAKLLASTSEERENYTEFANKIVDITQLLVDVLKLPPSALRISPGMEGKTVTWHDPCHLSMHMGVVQQPRQILQSIDGIEYLEMTDADKCCGMAGIFSIYFYDLSKKIADKKINNIMNSKADIVATGCPGCKIQLIDGAIRNKAQVQIKHIIELLH